MTPDQEHNQNAIIMFLLKLIGQLKTVFAHQLGHTMRDKDSLKLIGLVVIIAAIVDLMT